MTVTLAVAGFAASGHNALLVIGVVAVVGFWLLDAQIRAIQREFINRNKMIRESIRSKGLATVLDGKGGIHILGVPDVFREQGAPCPPRPEAPCPTRPENYALRVLKEAVSVDTFGLYVFLIVCLAVEAIFI